MRHTTIFRFYCKLSVWGKHDSGQGSYKGNSHKLSR